MSKKDEIDLLEKHREWVDHMYNPGYWVNRISYSDLAEWRWVRKHNRLVGGISTACTGLVVVLALNAIASGAHQKGLSFWDVIFDFGNPAVIEFLGGTILMGYFFAISVVLLVQRPIRDEPTSRQPERQEVRKKNLPKRRKDYR